ncbi:MAG: response regulator transcription factor [Flavobacteriales bacterium]|nr:response regulator transcription factor [Flavobacteriales bacterium]
MNLTRVIIFLLFSHLYVTSLAQNQAKDVLEENEIVRQHFQKIDSANYTPREIVKISRSMIKDIDTKSKNQEELQLLIFYASKLVGHEKYQEAIQVFLKLEKNKSLSPQTKYHLYEQMGITFSKLKSFGLSVKFLKKAINEGRGNEVIINGLIAGCFIEHELFDSSMVYYKRQLNVAQKTKDKIGILSSLNNIGWNYYKMKQADSAIFYFNKSITYIKNNNLSQEQNIMMNNINGNIGQCYLDKNKLDSAEHYLLIDYNTNGKSLQDDRYSFGLLRLLADVSLRKKDKRKALNYMAAMEVLLNKQSINAKIDFAEFQLDFTSIFNTASNQQYQELVKKYRELIQLHMIEEKKRELKSNDLISRYILAQAETQNELANAKLNETKYKLAIASQNEFKLKIILGSILIIILLLIVAVIQYYKQLKYKNKALESDLELKKQDVLSLGMKITHKHEVNKQILDKLKVVVKQSQEQIGESIMTLIAELNSSVAHNKLKNLVNENNELIDMKFFITLNDKHPDLNEKEKDLCVMIRMGLSNKEIAELKNISLNSVKVSKSRLKSKLEITNSFDSYILSL